MADRRQAAPRKQPAQKWPFGDRHVHLTVALHPTAATLLRLAVGFCNQGRSQRPAEQQRQDDDHQQAAGKFSADERPAQQDQQDQSELEDQVGGRKLEHDGGGKAGALAEQRPGDGDRRVGAG